MRRQASAARENRKIAHFQIFSFFRKGRAGVVGSGRPVDSRTAISSPGQKSAPRPDAAAYATGWRQIGMAQPGVVGTERRQPGMRYSEIALRHAGLLERQGDWLSGRAPRSHRGGHWFDPSIAHQVRGRSRVAGGLS